MAKIEFELNGAPVSVGDAPAALTLLAWLRARREGIRDLYLLTETAIDWFPRLGYEVVDRAVAAAAVGESIEFTTVCRDSGVPMHRSLA